MLTLSDTPTSQEMTSSEIKEYPTRNCGRGGNDSTSSEIIPKLKTEIKSEPPEDINDIGEDSSSSSKNTSHHVEGPRIRLTPTIKLMPVSNPVDPKRRFTCPYDNCTKSYGKSSHLRSHLTWHTGIKPFVCPELNCGKGFTRSDELNRHVRTHTGEKPFECIQCSKKFSRSDHLTKHLATHLKQMQNNSPKKIRKGDVIDVKKVDLLVQQHSCQDHNLTKYDCSDGLHFMAFLDSSGVDSVNSSNVKQEIENVTDNASVDHRPIKIKLERQESCEEYYVVPPDTTAGIDSSTSKHSLTLRLTSTIKGQEDKLCGSAPVIPSEGAVIERPTAGMQSAVYEVFRPWRCRLCEKKFKRQDDLNRHLRIHTGEKPFECTECGRNFVRSDHLKKHIKTHIHVFEQA